MLDKVWKSTTIQALEPAAIPFLEYWRPGLGLAGMNSDERKILTACLGDFVTVLCDGAYDTEGEHAHPGVIWLAYVMPRSITDDWGAWLHMVHDWHVDGRAPDGTVFEYLKRSRKITVYARPTGPFVARFWGDTAFAADLVAKAIVEGFDDKLLIFHRAEVDTLASMSTLLDLSKLCALDLAERLIEHIERGLAQLEADHDRAPVLQ